MPGMEILVTVQDSLLMELRSFLGITAEENYGGLAMGYQAHCIVMEEISRASGILRDPVLDPPASHYSRQYRSFICGAFSAMYQPAVPQRIS